MSLPDIKEMESYIRTVATQMGVDPEIAVRVAKSEGLAPGVWQSNIVNKGVREPSYGPFQLYEGGGLGNKFKSKYGVSASDPSTWKQQVQFAIQEAKKGGWGPWYGAKKAGIGNFEGIRPGASAPEAPMEATRGPNRGLTQRPEPQFSYSPSQGPGEAQSLTLMERLKNNKGNMTNFMDSLGSMAAQAPQAPPAPIAAPTGYSPMQIQGTRYVNSGKPNLDPSLLRKLGLI